MMRLIFATIALPYDAGVLLGAVPMALAIMAVRCYSSVCANDFDARGRNSNSGKSEGSLAQLGETPLFFKVLKWEEIRWDLR